MVKNGYLFQYERQSLESFVWEPCYLNIFILESLSFSKHSWLPALESEASSRGAGKVYWVRNQEMSMPSVYCDLLCYLEQVICSPSLPW